MCINCLSRKMKKISKITLFPYLKKKIIRTRNLRYRDIAFKHLKNYFSINWYNFITYFSRFWIDSRHFCIIILPQYLTISTPVPLSRFFPIGFYFWKLNRFIKRSGYSNWLKIRYILWKTFYKKIGLDHPFMVGQWFSNPSTNTSKL